MKPLSIKLKGKGHHGKGDTLDSGVTAHYKATSNTVFYYQAYRVVVVIDFSQSTTSLFPFETQTYCEKIKEVITTMCQNLLFKLENKQGKGMFFGGC